MLLSLKKLRARVVEKFRRTYTAEVCGHETKRKGILHGELADWSVLLMPLNQNGRPDYCLQCIEDMSVRCIRCGELITVGDQVSICKPVDPEYQVPPYVAPYENGYFVGCMRQNCADGFWDIRGWWAPPGKVVRVPSPIELAMQGGEHGSVVIVNDVSNYPNSASVHPLD